MNFVPDKKASSSATPAAQSLVQKKSLAQRQADKAGGFDVQMKALSPDGDQNIVDIQDPAAMAKYAEDAKNAPAPKGVDDKVMTEIEAEYQAATTPKPDKDKLGALAARCVELLKQAKPDQRQRLQAIIAAFTAQLPDNDIDIN